MSIKISHITSEAVTRARLINILKVQPNIVLQGDDIPPVLADHRHVAVGTRGLQRLLHLCRNGYHDDQGEASSERVVGQFGTGQFGIGQFGTRTIWHQG